MCGWSAIESGRDAGPGDGDAELPRAKGLFRTRDGPLGAGALMLLWQVRRIYLVVSTSRIMWGVQEPKKLQAITNYVQ